MQVVHAGLEKTGWGWGVGGVPSKLCADSLCECQANTIRAKVRKQGC